MQPETMPSRTTPWVHADRHLADLGKMENRRETEYVLTDDIRRQGGGEAADDQALRNRFMNFFQRKQYAGYRGVKRDRKTGRRAA